MKIVFTGACNGLIENFRGPNMLVLWFSLFYFLTISIGDTIRDASSPAFSLLEIVLCPRLLFIG